MAELDFGTGNLDYSALPFKVPRYRRDNFDEPDDLVDVLSGNYQTFDGGDDGVDTEGGDRAGSGGGGKDRAGTPPPVPDEGGPKTPEPPPPPPPPGPGSPPPPTNGVPPSPYTPSASSGNLEDLLNQLLTSNRTRSADRQAMWGRLTGLMDEYGRPVTADDPNIRSSVSSYQGQTDRALKNYREFAAERAHAGGMGSGAFDSQIGNSILTGGRAVGDFQNQLIRDETQSRRNALSDMIGKSAAYLSDEDRMGLEERMKAIDASLGKMGIDLNAELGRGRLALDKLLGEGQLGLGYAGVGASNKATDLANQHFYDDLDYKRSKDAQSHDDLLLQLLLGGG